MSLEQADDLVTGDDLLATKNPSFGLPNDPLDQRAKVVELALPECNRHRVGHLQ